MSLLVSLKCICGRQQNSEAIYHIVSIFIIPKYLPTFYTTNNNVMYNPGASNLANLGIGIYITNLYVISSYLFTNGRPPIPLTPL
jgi:hypothetical protein